MPREFGEISLELARRIDAACNRFESEWQAGNRPRVEVFLSAVAEADRVPLLQALLPVEFELRTSAGEVVAADEYVRRFRQYEPAVREMNLGRHSASSGDAADKAPQPTETVNRSRPDWSTASVPGPERIPSDLPEQFGRYTILRKLGQGGMGAVYLARDAQLDRQVALKVPHFSADSSGEQRERFFREARAAATIHHPNLCSIYDVGEIDGWPYLTMAYIEGRPLSRIVAGLSADKSLSERQVAQLVRKIALVLKEIHDHGIVHRDLKPSNIMIDHRKEPVIMDFGLARQTLSDDVRMTQSGAVLGSPAYMSPEQVLGRIDEIGPATDIYSLGVILYELLAGRLPFTGTVSAVLAQIAAVDPPPVTAYRPDVSPVLAAICARAIAKKIEDRHPSMHDLASDLAEFLKQKPVAGNSTVSFPELPLDLTSPFHSATRDTGTSAVSRLSRLVDSIRRSRQSAGILAAGLAGTAILAVIVLKLTTTDKPPTAGSQFAAAPAGRPSEKPPKPPRPKPKPPAPKPIGTTETQPPEGSASASDDPSAPQNAVRTVAAVPSLPDPPPTQSGGPQGPKPSVAGITIDLLKQINLKQDTVAGEWRFEGNELISPDLFQGAKCYLGGRMPDEFTLRAEVLRESQRSEALSFAFGSGPGSCGLILDGAGAEQVSGLELVDGKWAGQNEARMGGERLGGSRWHSIECRVSRDRILAVCDGEMLVNWKRDPTRIRTPDLWAAPDANRLVLGTYQTRYRVRRLELDPRVSHDLDDLKPGTRIPPVRAPVPVPNAEQREVARRQLLDSFKADFAAARNPQERRSFAQKLRKEAQADGVDPARQYVLLDEARQQAIKGGSLKLTLDCSEALAAAFSIDAGQARDESLGAFEKTPRGAGPSRTIVEEALELAGRHSAAGDFATARQILKCAQTASRSGRDRSLAARLKAVGDDLAALDQIDRDVRRGRETLATNPDDAESHVLLGLQTCLLDGKWTEGLEQLRKGSSEPLRKLAAQESLRPRTVSGKLELADSWWETGELYKAWQTLCRLRSVYWYGQVVPQAGGLSAGRIARLDQVSKKPLTSIWGPRLAGMLPPRLTGIAPTVHEDFSKPRQLNWKARQDGNGHSFGYTSEGAWFHQYVGTGSWWDGYSSLPGAHSDLALRSVGRVVGGLSDAWGLRLGSGNEAIRVWLFEGGLLRIQPTPAEFIKLPDTYPTHGDLPVPQANGPQEWNDLLITVAGRRLDVFVNGTRACDTVLLTADLPQAIAAITMWKVAGKDNQMRAENKSVTIWPLPKD